ncbi:hypothetical protein [Laribacter hongkongensis]|uniref:hypothetical protein n=1 Tax=Laribacter hongkongensis TaxID=168471 RepID=UPI0012DD2A7C|nr:hypothetical protein [Laribacter hongkongensis]
MADSLNRRPSRSTGLKNSFSHTTTGALLLCSSAWNPAMVSSMACPPTSTVCSTTCFPLSVSTSSAPVSARYPVTGTKLVAPLSTTTGPAWVSIHSIIWSNWRLSIWRSALRISRVRTGRAR